MGPAPDFDKSSYRNVKDSLGLDFPNLPYYIDGKEVSKRPTSLSKRPV